MKLNNLKPLESLQSLKPLKSINPKTKVSISGLNEIDIIMYSINLCYYSTRILRNEIKVNNRDIKLNIINKELSKLHTLLLKKDFLLHSNYMKKDVKVFYKKIGLRSIHLN